MRLCRFELDDVVLAGLYADDYVIPIDQAAEAYCEDLGVDLLLPTTGDLLELLPPDGNAFAQLRALSEWVEGLDVIERGELSIAVEDVQLLVPIGKPRKLLFVASDESAPGGGGGGGGSGDAAGVEEAFPYFFMKPPSTALTHPGAPVVLPAIAPDRIDGQCAVGVVIGRRCRGVSALRALECVAGYTVVNDISDRHSQPDLPRKPRDRDRFFHWLRGKWHDTFCPMGPCILTVDAVPDPQAFALRLLVNGNLKHEGSTAEMIFPVAAILAFLSRFVTLEPGDVVATGIPGPGGAGSGTFLKPGDVVEAAIAGIGTLENPVEAEEEE
jgi:2-keto-4-pentenoate hydratase/2-oxohepta-3-ene-1,7-dioic acid hydratase in catechol pathway